MLCFKSLVFLLISSTFFLFLFSHGASSSSSSLQLQLNSDWVDEDKYEVLVSTRRSVAEDGGSVNTSSLVLAQERTKRKNPRHDFNRYTGGWNISSRDYWFSVGFTAVPFFVIAIVWFGVFGLSLLLICCCYCCCRRSSYGYSRIAYALSLIFLILFTIAAIVGCVVLYTGQGKFHGITTTTLKYVVQQSDFTADNLRNVSGYLDAAQRVGVARFFLPANVQTSIDSLQTKINSSAVNLSDKTEKNSEKIRHALNTVRLILIVIAAVMLALAFIGFLLSIFGMRSIVYILVVIGWILVAGTFILCGVFLLLHNVAADTCVAMDQWVKNPTARTALDDILPCVDNATANDTLLKSKQVTSQLVDVVNRVISNISNANVPPLVGPPLYFNQSGPLMPLLCNPFYSDMSDRKCVNGEVDLNNATQVWRNYVCQVSSAQICTTVGRLTPDYFDQMSAAVNVSFGLYRYSPFLVQLQDCTFVRDTFSEISKKYCPDLRKYSKWIYIGLVMVSAAVMLSLIFWVLYARERRHRVYTKKVDRGYTQGPIEGKSY